MIELLPFDFMFYIFYGMADITLNFADRTSISHLSISSSFTDISKFKCSHSFCTIIYFYETIDIQGTTIHQRYLI